MSKLSGRPYSEVQHIVLPRTKGLSYSKREKHSYGFLSMLEKTSDQILIQRFVGNQISDCLAIGSNGFRITNDLSRDDLKRQNNSKTISILCLGGSTMMGLGSTDDRNTIPSLILDRLANDLELDKLKIEVSNMAMLRYTSFQELNILRDQISSFDFVVVLDGWNELDQFGYYSFHEKNQSSQTPPRPIGVTNKISNSLYSIKLLKSVLKLYLMHFNSTKLSRKEIRSDNYSLY